MKLFKKKENLLAIDIGSSSVKMLVMEGTAKKVKTTFENSVSFRIEKNEEPEREKEIIASAIKECVASLNLKKYNKIIFSIPVQNVIARIITIAAVPLDKLDSIISYEAEQHIPFPLSEVAFKYQLISYDDENMEILLTAVKQDRLNDLMDIVTSVGFEPELVDVTCFSLFKLLCFQKGLLDEKLKTYTPKKRVSGQAANENEIIAMVDIGSATTDITIGSGNSFYFTRSALIAGDHFTEAIQKKLNVTFDIAEKIKKEKFEIDLDSIAAEKTGQSQPVKNIFSTKLGKPSADTTETGAGQSLLKSPSEKTESEASAVSKPVIPSKPLIAAKPSIVKPSIPKIELSKPSVSAAAETEDSKENIEVQEKKIEQQVASQPEAEQQQPSEKLELQKPPVDIAQPQIGIGKPPIGLGGLKPAAGLNIPKPPVQQPSVDKPQAGIGFPKPPIGLAKPSISSEETKDSSVKEHVEVQGTKIEQPETDQQQSTEKLEQPKAPVDIAKPQIGIGKSPIGLGGLKPAAGLNIPKPPIAPQSADKPQVSIGFPKPPIGLAKPSISSEETKDSSVKENVKVQGTKIEQPETDQQQSTEKLEQPKAPVDIAKPQIGIGKPPIGLGGLKPAAGLNVPKPPIAPQSAEKPQVGIGFPKPPIGLTKPSVSSEETKGSGAVAEVKEQTIQSNLPPKPPIGGLPKPDISAAAENKSSDNIEQPPAKPPQSPAPGGLLKGMLKKPEIKPLGKPGLLKPPSLLKGSDNSTNTNQNTEGANKPLKLNLPPKPPGKSLGAAALDAISTESELDVNSLDGKEIFGYVKPTLDKLVTELKRSFDFFKSQMSGMQVNKILLTGGSAKLNGLDKYLEKKLGLQVEIFNPVLNIETKNINETSNEYSVALGLGMHNIFPVFPINVNLLPEEIIYKRIQAKQKKNVVLLVIFLVLALLEYSVKFYFELKQKEAELRYLEEEYRAQRIPSGEPGVNFSYEQIINEVNKAKEKKANFEKIKGIIENIQNEKARWLDVLAELSELLNNKFDGIYTGNIWIDRINFQEKKSITIVGYTKTYNMITNFIRALNKSKHFSVPENERPQQQEKVIDGETFIEFTLKADVKHYIESAKTEEEKNEVKKEESPKQPAAAAQEEKETKKTDNSEDDSEAEEE